ncbi:MAG: methionine gamma-lyase family protein [Candidatus Eremiobacteraeota bacterium]|nr:methionine gamma-lyase family protein [Candidatus Eremiobacteraeota bacterium]
MLAITKKMLMEQWDIPSLLVERAEKSLEATEKRRQELRAITGYTMLKVLTAFRNHQVSDSHFWGSTGYGFHDAGREVLDGIFAEIFGTEKALVRWQFVSGTHALASILFGALRPGDRWISLVGPPYDTLWPLIDGSGRWKGSLAEWGITYDEVPLARDCSFDREAIRKALDHPAKLVYLQRSLGYTWRPSITLSAMEELIAFVKSLAPAVIVMVDNCYGEFVEEREPTHIGADIMGGSLIKNAGGGLAPAGGYIAGKSDLVERASIYLTSPGIGPDEGATVGLNRLLFQGCFMAPSVVGGALEGAVWASHLLESLGFKVLPGPFDGRTDIIQAIGLGTPEALKTFCRGIQESSPVDHFALPEAVSMPGYRDPIIMAGGTFIQGSSIELSCDGPLREPYAAYLQGGLSFHHVTIGVMKALARLAREGLVTL